MWSFLQTGGRVVEHRVIVAYKHQAYVLVNLGTIMRPGNILVCKIITAVHALVMRVIKRRVVESSEISTLNLRNYTLCMWIEGEGFTTEIMEKLIKMSNIVFEINETTLQV